MSVVSFKAVLSVLLGLSTLLTLAAATAKEPAEVSEISVQEAFDAPQDHAGRVGLKCAVVEIADKERTFVVLDPNPPAGNCKEKGGACCEPKRLTVSVPKESFKGKLPKIGDRLVLVGDLKPLTVGFEFSLSEVRQAKKVILAKVK
jgi:hypothetical protein